MREVLDHGQGSRGGRRARGQSRGVLGMVKAVLNRGLAKVAEIAAPTEDALDALDLLKAQHKDVEKLFQEIGKTSGSSKRDLFHELADMLAVHATIEEKIFYPNIKNPSTQALLLESVEEHLAIKRLLADLLETDIDDVTFDAKMTVLEEQVMHHAKGEEEAKLFPLVRVEMDSDFRAALASEMIAMMVEMQQQGHPPRAHLPLETSSAAPI